MKYNDFDHVMYGTHAQRLADTKMLAQETSKWYEYDTGKLYVSDGTVWHEFGVAG